MLSCRKGSDAPCNSVHNVVVATGDAVQLRGDGGFRAGLGRPTPVRAALYLLHVLGFYRLCNTLGGNTPKILAYHTVISQPVAGEALSFTGVSATNFEAQLTYLARHYNVLSLDNYVQALRKGEKLPRNSVVITFDDGYQGTYTMAYPLLRRYGLSAAVFVPTGSVEDGTLQWDAYVDHMISKSPVDSFALDMETVHHFDLSTPSARIAATRRIQRILSKLEQATREIAIRQIERALRGNGNTVSSNLRPLTWNQLKEMSGNGITIGAHTVSHPNLTKTTAELAEYEVTESKRHIEQRLGREAEFFSYPFGDVDSRVKECVRSHYEGAVALENGVSGDLYALRRVGIHGPNTTGEFLAKLSALEPTLFQLAKRLRRRNHRT